MFIKQCKCTDADKLEIMDSNVFNVSKKYDGVYIQIHKIGAEVNFFTSSGTLFKTILGNELLNIQRDFILECEYIVGNGELGNRFFADNEIKKTVKNANFNLTGRFMIFDSIESEVTFEKRQFSDIVTPHFNPVIYDKMSYICAKRKLSEAQFNREEGFVLKKDSHLQREGKRVIDAVKLKKKYTADLICTKVSGTYISLIDEIGMKATVQWERAAMDVRVNDVIEIEYEQIVKSYIHPVFKCVRHDKQCN